MEKKKSKLPYLVTIVILASIISAIVLAAGRWDWIEMWIFLATYLIVFIAWGMYLKFKKPDLLQERVTAFGKGKKWDRILIGIYWILILAFLFTASLDAGRHQNFVTPIPIKIISMVFILAGYALGFWSGIANEYLSSFVRIQEERGHQVSQAGPYRFIRHPMYAGDILSYPFVALFLNSLWALIPAALIIVLFIVRTYLEDTTLQRELEGYSEYTQKVKYRLVPYVW
ncbi:MAG: isoprenylcysteine carboxylmethyltransferase family protein [Anaerolineales bacterium]|jgi:protein-S-isoprenylcysteine O-methyltransferase Ste14